MCGRFNYGPDVNHLQGWSNLLQGWPELEKNYNVAPTTNIAAFRSTAGQTMRWGMVPNWSKAFESKYATFNARIEGIENKPTFRNAWNKAQRCLIPLSGYYEWRGDKGNKQPHYITDRDTGGLVVAGLYEHWGDDQLSCTMITKPANDILSPIHPRMPILLTPKSAADWLAIPVADATPYLIEQNLESLLYYPVSTAVGNVRNNSAELIKPIDC